MSKPLTFEELGSLLEWSSRGGRTQHLPMVPVGTLTPFGQRRIKGKSTRKGTGPRGGRLY
jgi:hypothetical protein